MGSEDHRPQTKKEKEDLLLGKKGENVDKAPITSTFNTLNPLTWPH